MQLTPRLAAPLLAALLLAAVCPAQTAGKTAPAGTLKAILASARARVEKSDVRATGHLVQIAANGARTNNSLALDSHSFPDGLRTMITVTTPDHARVRYLLLQDESGHTSIEALHQGETTPVRLSVEHWGEGVAGTFFYPEDFANGQFFWAKQTVLPPQKYGARECFVLKSEPGPGEPTQYASVTTWMDQKTGAPVYVEAAPKNGGPTKQFVFYDLEQIGGLWLSRQVEAKLSGKPGSTLLLIDHGSPHAHLTRKDFSLTAASSTGGNSGP
jgi:Outer membrane lipoprotein-sorting protein